MKTTKLNAGQLYNHDKHEILSYRGILLLVTKRSKRVASCAFSLSKHVPNVTETIRLIRDGETFPFARMWFWSFSRSYLYITLSAPFFFNSVFVLDAVMKFTPITVLKMSVWQLVWAWEKQFLWVPWSNARTSRSLKPELSQCPTSALTLQYWANGDSPSADRYSFYVAFILRFLSATWIICLPRVLAAAAVSSCQGRHSFLDRPWH